MSAYRTVEGGKYYSAETQSSGQYLPEYTPLDITLDLGGVPLSRDENGVFHAYVRDEKPYLTYLYVTCDQTDDFTVTRMDTGAPAERDHVSPTDTFVIPDFTGTLMLKIDAVKGKDVTSVFLLVSRDETPPVLTLSDPIFYADKDTGAYSITGTADAGSLIHYGTRDSLYAGSDGSFTISGTLDEGKTMLFLPSTPRTPRATNPRCRVHWWYGGERSTPSPSPMTATAPPRQHPPPPRRVWRSP